MLKVSRRVTGWLDSRQVRTIEWWLFALVMLFVWGLDTHGSHAGTGDEPHYQMIAHSLVFDRDVDLTNNYSDPKNLVGDGHLQPEAHVRMGRDGRLRPVHDIGLPVLFAPYFSLAYRIAEHSPEWIPPRVMARARLNPPLVLRHLLSLAMIPLTGLMAVLLFRICRPACESLTPAFVWTLLFVLSPPLLSHSYLFFTEIPTALVVTICWLALNAPFPQRRLRTALLGAAVGFLLLLHIRNVGLVLGLLALFAGRIWRLERRTTHLAWFLAPLAAFAVVRTVVNFVFWGSFVTGPHASIALPTTVIATATEIITRAFGLLIDQEHGLLAYAPVYVLVLPGFILLWRSDRTSLRDACLLLLAYLVPVVAPMLNRHGWDGGWSPAARLLVPVAPILAAVGFRYVARLGRVPITVMVVCLAQTALDFLYWSRPKLLWNIGDGKSALAAFLSTSRVDVGAWLPSWHVPSVYSVVLSLCAVTVWTVVSVRAVGDRSARG